MNRLTRYISLALDILFLKQPTRTSVGLILGLSSRTLFKFLSIWIIAFQAILSIGVSIWEFGLLGIFIVHIPTLIDVLSGKYLLTENEEKALAMIKEMKISDYDKQALYLDLVKKTLEKVNLNQEVQDELRKQSS